MKKAKKPLALLLALVMCLGLVACGNSGTTESQAPADNSQAPADNSQAPAVERENSTPLVAAASGYEGKFSPFFGQSADDMDVADLVSLYLGTVDRVSNPILLGIEGETRSYNGTDYTYNTACDIVITENADGTVYYDITMRDDIVFSDGVPATMDDVIFSFYVLADPTYDGSSTVYALPIEGMEEYRSGMGTLGILIAEAGEDNTDFTFWDEATQTAFWSTGLPEAGAAFAQSIVDYVYSNYGAAYELADPSTGAEAYDACAGMWGFSGGSAAEMWDNMVAAYEGDYQTMSDTEAASGTLWSYLDAAYQVGVETGASAPSISGFQKTGDYSLRIVATKVDATMIYQVVSLLCAPLHYYGDESLYDYDNNMFGFPKGDLSIIKSKTSTPVGAGPYLFKDYSNGTVYLEANPLYWEGEPAQRYLNFLETTEAEHVSGLKAGTLDIGNPSYSGDVVKELQSANSNGETTGDVITTVLIDYRGYGYVGCNPNLVKVGDDPYSDQSKALRKAILTMISVYRDEGIDSYYGDTASVINYPISSTSWAAPQVTDDGYRVAYSVGVDGTPIYSSGMSAADKYAAAKEACLKWFEAAGYTVEGGKVTAAPEGAKLNYQVEIGGNGQGDHPTFLILKNAAEALAEIGITLNVKDWAQPSDLYNTYQTGVAEFWCAAWRASSDPDMFQLYHSEGTTNYYHIADDELDELIMEGRASTNQTYRKGIYQAAMEIIMDYGVELPVYQRSECTLFSSQRVNMDTVQTDMTPYWTWKAGISTLESLL